ncbi:hypothetical protein BH10BAC4_BH10BAC4_02080 [soil metagenome]
MRKFWLQSLIITSFVFFLLWTANQVTDLKIFTDFDAVGKALGDFELTDIVFSRIRSDDDIVVDDRIILVNIGNIPRRAIAQQIFRISEYKPRIIGFDGFFICRQGLRDSINCPALLDTLGNLMLSSAIQAAPKFVLGTRLLQTKKLGKVDSNESDSLQYSDPMFNDYAEHGFVTLPTNADYQEDVKQCRTVWPKFMVKGKEELAFAVRIAMLYDSVKTKKFLARGIEEELVNFKRNIEVKQLAINSLKDKDTNSTNNATQYYVIDVFDMLEGNVLPEVFKDKIVLMGYLGDYVGQPSWDDKFFTPMNKIVGGRANPDMFGLVIHANIIGMILDEDYINTISDTTKYLIAIMVCLLTVALFIYIDYKLPMWFDAMSFVIQLLEVVFISGFTVFAFVTWNLKLDLKIAIGISALVGPAYDIFKSLQNEFNRRLTKRRERVLKT